MKAAKRIAGLFLLMASLSACTAAPTPTATPAAPGLVQVTVYFTDRSLIGTGTPPFEVAVSRSVPATANLPEAVLAEYFRGPTPEERARGLEAITSGFTGFNSLEVQDSVAHVRLAGPCAGNGASYTIAAPLLRNLRQFPEIVAVKIYDAEGVTEQPDGETTSIPPCLEP